MNVCGLGLDMLDISRMESKLHDARFMERVFTDPENEYIRSRGKFSASSAAGIFCAKEAFMKAVGEGLAIPLQDMEVCRDERGKPFLRLYGRTEQRFGMLSIELSITHTSVTAAAVVILSGMKEGEHADCGQ